MARWTYKPRTVISLRLTEASDTRVRNFVRINRTKRYGETLSRNSIIQTAVDEWLDRNAPEKKTKTSI